MTLLAAWSAALASAAVLALILARLGLGARLMGDALAIGVTLGATTALMLAPFELRANPLHLSPAAIAFGFAGGPEEAIKLLGMAAFLRAHFRARSPREVMLACGGLALGFATLENLFYLANAGAAWAPLAAERALTAGPFHVLLGLAGGFVVARASAGRGGAALLIATGAGLAAIHGLYDFGVLAAQASPGAGAWLRALMVVAEAAAALAAALALRASPGAQGRGLLASRALGFALAGALAGGAVLSALGGLLAIYALDSLDTLGLVAVFGILPLALGLMAAPAPPSRRTLAAFGLILMTAGTVAGVVWGPAGWRWLETTHGLARGARLAGAGDLSGAEQALDRAVAASPGRPEPLALRARVRLAAKRLDAALADYDAALAAAPSAALYAQRADLQRRRNDPAAARDDLNAALRLVPDDAALLALRGQAKLEAGDAKGAYADLSAASAKDPGAALVRDLFAGWDVDAGDYDAALRDLNQRLHDHPGDPDAIFRRGRAWFYKGEFARAEADFATASAAGQELYPALWRALAQQGRLLDFRPDLRTRLTTGEWPAPVARMFLGEIDYSAARALAADAGERCEADFYYAASRLGLDASDASAERLRAALGECPTAFIEYEGAKAELRRLGF